MSCAINALILSPADLILPLTVDGPATPLRSSTMPSSGRPAAAAHTHMRKNEVHGGSRFEGRPRGLGPRVTGGPSGPVRSVAGVVCKVTGRIYWNGERDDCAIRCTVVVTPSRVKSVHISERLSVSFTYVISSPFCIE